MESAALRLFNKSDKENKGFIIKRDMQRMKDEIPLPPEQLELVFDTLDTEKNGYLTLDQFLKGFRKYLFIISSNNDYNNADHLEELDPITTKHDFSEELNMTMNLIKETNVLKTSADELEYISEQMKDGIGCQLPQWEIFLKNLYQDLQSYKETHSKLEKFVKQRDSQHQNYVKKIFEEIECQLKEKRKIEEFNEQTQNKIKEEIRLLRTELFTKDELLQQLSQECKELKKKLCQLYKKEEETSSLNSTLINQQNYYESELEVERLKRNHVQNLLDNIRRRFSIEKSQCFKDGFHLAKRVVNVQEEGLLQQLQMLQDMQRVLENNNNVH